MGWDDSGILFCSCDRNCVDLGYRVCRERKERARGSVLSSRLSQQQLLMLVDVEVVLCTSLMNRESVHVARVFVELDFSVGGFVDSCIYCSLCVVVLFVVRCLLSVVVVFVCCCCYCCYCCY